MGAPQRPGLLKRPLTGADNVDDRRRHLDPAVVQTRHIGHRSTRRDVLSSNYLTTWIGISVWAEVHRQRVPHREAPLPAPRTGKPALPHRDSHFSEINNCWHPSQLAIHLFIVAQTLHFRKAVSTG